MAKVGKLSKEKGIQVIADMLYDGKNRPEILQTMAKAGNGIASTVDKWIKDARPIYERRKAAANALRAEKDAEEIEAIAKELGISRRTQLAELRKVAYMDPRKLYHDDGSPKDITELDDETAGAIAGIETLEERDPLTRKVIGTTKKLKKEPKLTAISEINRMMGWTTPAASAKVELESKDGVKGTAKKISVTLNLS